MRGATPTDGRQEPLGEGAAVALVSVVGSIALCGRLSSMVATDPHLGGKQLIQSVNVSVMTKGVKRWVLLLRCAPKGGVREYRLR